MLENKKMEIKHFAIGIPKTMEFGIDQEMQTAICKEAVEEAFLTKDGFQGDGRADQKHHSGLDRAVCLYPYEHYAQWEKEFQTLSRAAFGENLTVSNMLERDVCIGDIFQIGDAVVQVTQARIPCSTITRRNNINDLLKRIVETGYTGYLCRVLKEGTVKSNSNITLKQAHPKQVTIQYCNEIYFHDQKNVEGIEKILEVAELADDWRDKLTKRLEKLTNSSC
ncbi:MOSC domain-containing protein [Bacillus massilioanorexius]|uniref:MOSC domain-containing protein n=1 Tax=Bacillus TaxID=1386 RepID=UPI000303ED1B